MGRLNYMCLMCPFLNGFKRPLNDVLALLQVGGKPSPLLAQAKKDLLIWVGFLTDPEKWNPIPPKAYWPPSPLEGVHYRCCRFRNPKNRQNRLWSRWLKPNRKKNVRFLTILEQDEIPGKNR